MKSSTLTSTEGPRHRPGASATASFQLGTRIDDEVNARVQRIAATLLHDDIPGVLEVVPSYAVVNVEYDPRRTSFDFLAEAAQRALLSQTDEEPGDTIVVPTAYDGPDIETVAKLTGTTGEAVAQIHASVEYRVHALGFTPGFAFMASVDPRLQLPRRSTPRPAVPPCSVAIANAQTGVYPLVSPGGWHVIGRSLVAPYDPRRPQPFLFQPGARVRFMPSAGVSPQEPQYVPLIPDSPRRPTFEVLRAGPRDLVVDAGRFGVARFGLARSGAIDQRAMADANTHVGNPRHAACLEMALRGPTLRALRPTTIGVAGYAMQPTVNGQPVAYDRPIEVRTGDTISFEPCPTGTTSYLALPGGIESASRHGSVSVDVRGRLGRALARGDVLGQRHAWHRRSRLRVFHRQLDSSAPLIVRVVPGPQASKEALALLDKATFTVTASDRMGVLLDGSPIPTQEIISEPTELGAMQITTAGLPIVLLNDRGTLGGYGKPAIVVPCDLSRLAQARAGDTVQVRVVNDNTGQFRRLNLPA